MVSEWLERFLVEAERSVPDVRTQMLGTPASVLDRYERLISQPLPAQYCDFARALGEYDGGLNLWRILGSVDSRVGDLVESQQEALASGEMPGDDEPRLRAGWAMFLWDDHGEVPYELSLGEPPHMVQTYGQWGLPTFWAASFEGLLYRNLILRFGARGFRHAQWWGSSVEHLPSQLSVHPLDVAARAGLSEVWYSDAHTRVFEAAGDALLIVSQQRWPFVAVAADSPDRVAELLAPFQRELRLERLVHGLWNS